MKIPENMLHKAVKLLSVLPYSYEYININFDVENTIMLVVEFDHSKYLHINRILEDCKERQYRVIEVLDNNTFVLLYKDNNKDYNIAIKRLKEELPNSVLCCVTSNLWKGDLFSKDLKLVYDTIK